MAGRPESPLSVGSVGLRAKRPTRSGTRGGSKSQRNPSKAKPATEAGGVSRRGIRPTEAGRAEAERRAAEGASPVIRAPRRGGAGGSPGGKKKSYAANRNMGYRNKTPAEMKRIGRTLSRMGPSPGGGR